MISPSLAILRDMSLSLTPGSGQGTRESVCDLTAAQNLLCIRTTAKHKESSDFL